MSTHHPASDIVFDTLVTTTPRPGPDWIREVADRIADRLIEAGLIATPDQHVEQIAYALAELSGNPRHIANYTELCTNKNLVENAHAVASQRPVNQTRRQNIDTLRDALMRHIRGLAA